jgi:sigma-B regulation protein RsbU (phosphoserine phosphatase)
MEEELKLAREVQQAAIPRFLPITSERMRFSHYYLPASDLAGDFFEVLPLGPEKAAFLVCDVMGLGVRAALIVSMLRGLLEKGQEKRESPGKFLEGLNAGLCHLLERTGITIFATALYGVVDLGKGMITIASAGHPDPLLKRKNGVSSLDFEGGSKGPALGLVAGASFGEVVISVNEVVALWCFTDGIYEVRDAAGNELGERGLTSRLEKDSTLEGLIRYAREFAAEGQFDDDVCLLGLELS